MSHLPTEIWIEIYSRLDQDSAIHLILASRFLAQIFASCMKLLRNFKLNLSSQNFSKIVARKELLEIPFKNISICSDNKIRCDHFSHYLRNFSNSIENLEIENLRVKSFRDFKGILKNLRALKSLSFKNCHIEFLNENHLKPIKTLKSISFEKCNDNIFKVFEHQTSLEKITVGNNDWTWNGFPHEIFNNIAKNCKNLDHIVLIGSGTGSYFDCDEFPFKIRKLEATMITFHWYVGIKSQRITFPLAQQGHLKELTIHMLPFDFDGGRVLKFLIEDMGLEKFYYGRTPLILDSKKQLVESFEANEVQLTSSMEMLKQFPSIKSFRLILTETDIASDEIEKKINPPTNLFDNLEEFEVFDKSRYRCTFGVFLGLYRNLKNIKRVSFITADRNINVILEESLVYMINLEEIYLPTSASRNHERLQIIKENVPKLKKITVAPQFFYEAKTIFDSSVNIQIVR